MPRGRRTSDEDRREMLERYARGESKSSIARMMGVSWDTVNNIVKQTKGEGDGMSGNKVVAGNRTDGRLMTTGAKGKYQGSCNVGSRKFSKVFRASDIGEAKAQWREWCDRLRAEHSGEPEVDVTPAPVPEVVVTRKAQPSARDDGAAVDVDATPRDDPDAAQEPPASASETEPDDDREAYYAVLQVRPEVHGIGLYGLMDEAFDECERMNEVARMLGMGDAFEVHELVWKG